MNTLHNINIRGSLRHGTRQRGFTLVELMVTVAIAMFLLGGLVTILQNVRKANVNQQALAQLQDQQRFAMTVISDMIQQGGYYPSMTVGGPTNLVPATALGAAGPIVPGQAFYSVPLANPATLTVRFMTAGNDGVIMCDGSTNIVAGSQTLETNVFTVVPPAPPVPGQLLCSLNGGAQVALANGVTNLQVYYGVNRANPLLNYNVDTYLTADQMNAGLPNGGDWMNISSVRVVLTFTNPLYDPSSPVSPGNPQTITFERVVMVMGRAGVHS